MTCLKLLLLLILVQLCLADEEGSHSKDSKEAEEDDIAQNYLYLPLGDEADPVIDYRPKKGEDPERPDFIYGANNGPRVALWYASWCPHCQHFRDHYIGFGEEIQKLALQQPEKVDVKVYAVSCGVNRALCKAFGVNTYPQIRLFKAGATNATGEAKYWQLHPFDVLKDLGLQTAELNLELPLAAKKKGTKSRPDNLMDIVNVRTKQDVYNDAWLSFDYAMKNGVFTNDGPLSNTTQTHLKDWLDLLHKALPPSWQIQNAVKALRDNFSKVIQSESQLFEILAPYPPPKKKWSPSCTHGDPVAGYTCGLWELFHLVTVGVVEYNLMIATDDGEIVIHTENAAVAIRNYVESFFGCEVCRINFVSAFDRCSFNRCTRLSHASYRDTEWIQLPVWLWETHNSVNVRLLHEKGKRENWEPKHQDEVNKQWPSRDSCPKCWGDHGGWDDETIYKYLRLEYWPEDELSETYRTELLLSEAADEEDNTNKGGTRLLSPLLLGLMFVGIGASAGLYAKRQKRWMSGRHKKSDESFASNNYESFDSNSAV